MASLRCSCGEYLLPKKTGLTVCWFCRKEYDKEQAEIMQMDFEPQERRQIVKSVSAPMKRDSRVSAVPLPDGFRFFLES